MKIKAVFIFLIQFFLTLRIFDNIEKIQRKLLSFLLARYRKEVTFLRQHFKIKILMGLHGFTSPEFDKIKYTRKIDKVNSQLDQEK